MSGARPLRHGLRLALGAALALAAVAVGADQTKIADEPPVTMGAAMPKPNLLVIVDDSGNMGDERMPEALARDSIGFGNHECNPVAYNPGRTYTPPLRADGKPFPDADFARAPIDGFRADSATIDLHTQVLASVGGTDDYLRTIYDAAGKPYFRVRMASAAAPGEGARVFTVSSLNVAQLGPRSFIVGDPISLRQSPDDASVAMAGTIRAWQWNAATKTGVLRVDVTQASGSASLRDWYVGFPGRVYYVYRGQVPAGDRRFRYDDNGQVVDDGFHAECSVPRDRDHADAHAGVFELRVVSNRSPAAERTNYANWFAYYRTRLLTMRSAMGRALQPLDAAYRVGFMTINRRSDAAGSGSAHFLPVDDFGGPQKEGFYGRLYSVDPSGDTPLRGALSTAGRYFARDLERQQTDPMQYACQRNVALLATGGYWNESFNGYAGLGGSYIGNADGTAGAPYADTHALTLADVAHYYYQHDLRAGAAGSEACRGAPVDGVRHDVCADTVPPIGNDGITHQRMVTYAIGLGVAGALAYDRDYRYQAAGDYADIVAGRRVWPRPQNDRATTIDDLWHAAVNGRGRYYAARDADELVEAIQGVVATVQETTGAAVSASTSALGLVQGEDNLVVEASYTTGTWTGDVVARRLDARTAAPEDAAPLWSARERLERRTAARRVYFAKPRVGLQEFTWDNLGELRDHFRGHCAAGSLSQCADLGEAQRAIVDAGERLVDYLRGARADEATATNTRTPLFRARASLLGDVIHSKPIHVGAPPFHYGDAGYAAFKKAHRNRRRVVYVGANDGMLHALDAATGDELWAFVPTAVMPNLYRLADTRYGSRQRPHQYYVDGKTVQGDVYVDGAWRTILVGGLGKGGRAYYALDVTDPEAPRWLWEYTHDDLGLSFGEPIITKYEGRWVVAFASGYGNVSPGDGRARLFMVDAGTGHLVKSMATDASANGMARVNVWNVSASDNTALHFYGGDVLGNVWRFDPLRDEVTKLAEMKDPLGRGQPITTEIKLRQHRGETVLVVTTGRYLHEDDVEDVQVQSVAAIRDPGDETGWGDIRNGAHRNRFKVVTIGRRGTEASGEPVPVDWSTEGGWRVDFPTPGERVHVNAEWDGATLLVATVVPQAGPCSAGGASWMYRFGVDGGQVDGLRFGDEAMLVGFTLVRNDAGDVRILARDSSGRTRVEAGPELVGGRVGRVRRVSWRELVHERPEAD